MAVPVYPDQAALEQTFWLQVLGDHARFIWDGLSPREPREVERAQDFAGVFDQLLHTARHLSSPAASQTLAREAYAWGHRLREFKLHLLRRHLREGVRLQLPPTFLNHMLNELEEALRVFNALAAGQAPPQPHPVHHHLLWLLDASGHAATLASLLDMSERSLIERSDRFTQEFDALYLKAVETAGYLRTQLAEFPALARLHQEAVLSVRLFQAFLQELAEMSLDHSLLSSLSPLMPDHMAREACYYLHKLAPADATAQPACDPTQPRGAGLAPAPGGPAPIPPAPRGAPP
ncbi:MAG: DUF2935 domain-containing protein, partial [Alicyclobacillus sp.]|nr:DUF2935 domain-containing protein [Alicyclobacillus sp.]